MFLIAAALDEELETGLGLCSRKQKVSGLKACAWQGERGGSGAIFLKTGVGPNRAASSLQEALLRFSCSGILIIGYAGALDPALKVGDLVVGERAIAFRLDETNHDWEHVRLEGTYLLSDSSSLLDVARSAGLDARKGDVLSSPYVLGEPSHKALLHDRFRASIVDMETAFLARIASRHSIPVSCIRVVSDESEDSFLAPFSYDPATRLAGRARKLAEAGMINILRKWKANTRIAREKLTRFLDVYWQGR